MATAAAATAKDSPTAVDAATAIVAATAAATAIIVAPATAAAAAGVAGEENSKAFNMCLLKDNIPKKRKGLSKFYSGKSKSFQCLSDAKTIHDLKKEDNLPEIKRRKYLHRREKIDAAAATPFSGAGAGAVKCNS